MKVPVRKLQLLHIGESYPPDYGGGAAIVLQDLCRSLAERGHDVRVLCVENSEREPYTLRVDWDGDIRIDRLNLPYFKAKDPDGWGLGLLSWKKHESRVTKLVDLQMRTWTPDLVHYHTTRPLGEAGLLSMDRRDIPVVAMLHEAWTICPRLMLLRSPTSEACTGPKPSRCIECIYSHYDGSHRRAWMKLPWRVLKLGIYPAYRLWRRSRARGCITAATTVSHFMTNVHQPHIDGEVLTLQLGLPHVSTKRKTVRASKPLRFGFVAGFQPNKGIWHVLDAAASLMKEGLSFELHVWGPGHESDADEIRSRGLEDRVFLRGMYQSEQIWQVYAEVDVALMATTVCEPLGRVPIEAGAVGLPTIAPAIGGITESIRDNVDGLLYRFQDAEHLKHQMRRVLEEKGLIERLASNLRPAPHIEQMALAVEEFYIAVLATAQKTRLTARGQLPAPIS